MTRLAAALLVLVALAPAAARAQDAGVAQPPQPATQAPAQPPQPPTHAPAPPVPPSTLPAPLGATPPLAPEDAPPDAREVAPGDAPEIAVSPLSAPQTAELPQGTLAPLAGDADLDRTRPVQAEEPGAAFLPGPSSARNYQYGAQLRYGTLVYHGGQVDSTSVQLELLLPFAADSFLTPHVGASWGNFGHPATAFASGAWTIDFGLTLSWIVLSWNSYVLSAQSWFNLELGADLEASVQSLRTGAAAGGAIDIQSDFLLSLRPMARVVAMIDRHVSVYVGVSLSWYDLTGRDDFIHGSDVAHRPSQLVLGIELTPQGRTVRGGTSTSTR